MFCAKCGQETAKGARFCRNCGTAQRTAEDVFLLQQPKEKKRGKGGLFAALIVLPLAVACGVGAVLYAAGGARSPESGRKPAEGQFGGAAGTLHKGKHKRCFAYEAHTVCDRHDFILDTVVTVSLPCHTNAR